MFVGGHDVHRFSSAPTMIVARFSWAGTTIMVRFSSVGTTIVDLDLL